MIIWPSFLNLSLLLCCLRYKQNYSPVIDSFLFVNKKHLNFSIVLLQNHCCCINLSIAGDFMATLTELVLTLCNGPK